jgi:hypothetical protein
MAIDRPFGDAGFGSDRPRRRAGDAVRPDGRDCGFEDLFARVDRGATF